MATMRILHLVGRSHRRGAEQVAQELAVELEARGHQNRLLAVSLGHDGERVAGLEPLVGQVAQRPTQLVEAVWRLRGELRRGPVDVVLAHGAAAALVAALAARSMVGAAPRVMWQTTSALALESFGLLQRACWRVALPGVDGAVSLTAEIGEQLRAFGYRGPMWAIPNARRADRFVGLDRTREARSLRAEVGVGPDVALLGLVGYLVPEKDPTVAVEVLAALQQLGADAHLVVVGSGPLEDEVVATVARTGLTGRVSLLGHRDDVAHVLGGIDLLLLTSSFEGVPGILIEAAMAGCPAVTFPVGEVAEVVVDGETGVITPEATVPSMAAILASLLADPDRRRALGEAARAHGARFTMDAVADRYEAHLAALVGVTS
jgi:glycosyltransferase involved in cell wall biosynthesis